MFHRRVSFCPSPGTVPVPPDHTPQNLSQAHTLAAHQIVPPGLLGLYTPLQGRTPSPVDERAVRILLECFLGPLIFA